MKIIFRTAVGAVIGLLMAICLVFIPDVTGVRVLLTCINYPGILLCMALSFIGLLPHSGANSDWFDWIFLGVLLQWTLLGFVCGVVLEVKARRKRPATRVVAKGNDPISAAE